MSNSTSIFKLMSLLGIMAGAALISSPAISALILTDACSTNEVTLGGESADFCAGAYEGNDSTALFNDHNLFGINDGWYRLTKVGEDGLEGTNVGLTFNETAQTWSFNLAGLSLSNFAVVFKQSTEWAAYQFIAPFAGNDGTYNLGWAGGTLGDLSHVSIYANAKQGGFGNDPDPLPVPAPSPLLLGGLGMLLVALSRRRRMSRI